MLNIESQNIPWVCSYINVCGRAVLIGDNIRYRTGNRSLRRSIQEQLLRD